MKAQLFLIFALLCVYGTEVRSHEHEDAKRQLAAGVVTESPADALMRLKLMTYEEKLKAKAAKKQAKADKKAQKDAAFGAYMSAIAAGAVSPAAAGAAPAPAAAPMATVVPPMPMLPAMGLWKKSFLLSQIMAAAAAQNAQIAAAAAAATTTTTTTPAPATLPAESDEDDDSDEDKTINEIVKRYAPMLRKKFYGVPHRRVEEEEEDAPEEDDTEDIENEEQALDDEDEDEPASYQSGSFNKFGTGPAGSPNGVGYEDAKVNQAGCSGSHIHICSGTTVYLTNPDDVTNDNPLLQDPELKVQENESEPEEEEEEVSHPKFGKTRAHAHRH